MDKINFDELKRLIAATERAKKDPLVAFVSGDYIEGLADMRAKNLQNLFKLAKKYKVRYIHLDHEEICGCEKKKQPGEPGWPAMWAIAQEIGFPGSCGNGDQYQCMNAKIAFPEDSFGGWDLKTNTKLTDEEVKQMKFYHVVAQFRPRK